MITRYVEYLDQLVMYVPSCPNAIILNAIKRAGRKFCEESEAWRTTLTIDTVADQAEYTLVLPSSTEMRRIVEDGVELRGSTLYPEQFTVGVSALRADEHAPSGSIYVASGAGLCDGESPIGYYKLTDNQDSFQVYTGIDINFRLLVDFLVPKVDLLKTGTVEINGWKIDGSSNPIGDYTAVNGSGAISVAAVSGTVVPDPTIKLLQAPGESETGALTVDIVLIPEYKSDGLPIDFLNRYGDGIMGGALDILMRMPNSPWANPQAAVDFKKEYFTQINRARRDNLAGRRY